MPTISLTVTNEVANRLASTYGVPVSGVKDAIIDRVKSDVRLHESNIARQQAALAVQTAQDEKALALANAQQVVDTALSNEAKAVSDAIALVNTELVIA